MNRHIIWVGLTSVAVASPTLAQDYTFTHPSGATATFYGQLNLTYQGVDDGVEKYDELADNGNSVSRIGLWLDMPFDNGNKLRFNFETGLGLKSTFEINQVFEVDRSDFQRTDLRKLELVYTGGFGSVWLGQGSMATDAISEMDKSGTTVAGYVAIQDIAGAFALRDGDTLAPIVIGEVFRNYDGGRRMRLRYDTPEISSVTYSLAYGKDILSDFDEAEYYDIAMRYAFENDLIELGAALGYGWRNDVETTETLSGSASILHKATGLNATLAGADVQSGHGAYAYLKLGWRGDVWQYGETALSVDYYDGADVTLDGGDSTSWGVQAVQNFDDQNLEVYAGYRRYSYDDATAARYHDLDVVLVGARLKF